MTGVQTCALPISLGLTFEMVSKGDSEMKAEIANWDDGRVVSMGVLPDGPSMHIKKDGDRIIFLGTDGGDADLKVLLKNMDCAFVLFTGQIGPHTGFIQHRAIVHGDINEAMQFTRTIIIVQSYLFPGLLLKKIFKRPPKMTGSQLLLKAKVMALLGPMLLIK